MLIETADPGMVGSAAKTTLGRMDWAKPEPNLYELEDELVSATREVSNHPGSI